jgi:uncharacterized membrane protein YkoI
MAKYWGIASANGIESFIFQGTGKSSFDEMFLDRKEEDIKKEKESAYQTVYWNRHRHTVLYEVEIEVKDAREIEYVLENDPAEALILLKEKAKKIAIAKMPGSEKSWNLIPNPNLSPF